MCCEGAEGDTSEDVVCEGFFAGVGFVSLARALRRLERGVHQISIGSSLCCEEQEGLLELDCGQSAVRLEL